MTGADVTTAPLVRIRGLTKSFGDRLVLAGIDLDFCEGEVTAILGPSGSGKSTLLRCINHLEQPDAGVVEVAGELVGVRSTAGRLQTLRPREITRQRRQMGMVFQQFNLFPHMTVLDNLLEGPLAAGWSREDATPLVVELLARVGLAGREGAHPRRLSGGQQQRVAIARAMALHPRLLLLDEPTSALDPELVGEVLGVIRDLARDGMTMVVVTHEVRFVRDAADRVVFLDGGVVVEQGPAAEVLAAPHHERAKAYLQAVR